MFEEGFLVRLGAPGDALQLTLCKPERQVDAAHREKRAYASMNGVQARHQEIERLAIERWVGEELVEAGLTPTVGGWTEGGGRCVGWPRA